MSTIKFSKEYMLYNLYHDDYDDGWCISNEHVKGTDGTFDLIFKYDNRYWYTRYYDYITEVSYTKPWLDDDEVICHEVHAVDASMKIWRKVDDN